MALAASLVTLSINPNWRAYPNLVKWVASRPSGSEGPRVSGSVLTLPEGFAAGREYAELITSIGKLRNRGFSVGILDQMEASFYLDADRKPSDRHVPLLAGAIWKHQFQGVKERFIGRRFDYVAKQCGDSKRGSIGDEDLAEFAHEIEPFYGVDSRSDGFEIWRRKDLNP